MSYLPRNVGETDAAWDARMAAAWARAEPITKKVSEMDGDEKRAALVDVMRPAPRHVAAPFPDTHLRDLSPHQRADAARQLGISHLFPSFR